MINIVATLTKKATAATAAALKRAQFEYASYYKRAILAFETGLFFWYKENKDTINLTDTDQVAVGKGISNTSILSDSLSRTVSFNRSFTDATSVTENLSKTVQFSRIFQDGAQVGDSYTDQVNFNRSPEDGVQLGDGIDYFAINKNIADTVSATDDTNGALIDDDQVANFTKLRQDGFHISESLTSSVIKVFQDSYSVDATVKSDVAKSLSDSYNIYTQVYSDVYKVRADNFIVSDATAVTNQFNRSFNHTAQFGDDIDSFQVGKGHTDVLQVLEVISNGVSTPRSDSYLVSDNLATSVNYWRTPLNGIELVEDYYIGISKNHSNITQLSDNAQVSIGYVRNFTDSLTATDDLNGTAVGDDQLTHIFKVKSDGTTLADVLTTSTNKGPSDSTGITDTGAMYFQNYAGNYFSADYVGGSRAFT